MSSLVQIVRLGRPLFLAGGFVFHALGIAIALYQGASLNRAAALWGQIAITATQLMTHYANDYFDLDYDRANTTPTHWSGGSRVLVENRLPARLALYIAAGLGIVALIATFILGIFIQPAWATIPLLLTSIFLAWEYSAPPLRLHSRGLGALTVMLIVPVLTPVTGAFLQAGYLTSLVLLAVWPLACLQAAMISAIDFPDAAGDRKTGKNTLVVRLGAARATRVHLLLLVAAYLPLPILVNWGLPAAIAAAVLLPLPIALWLATQIAGGAGSDPARWNRLGFWSVALLIGTATLETAAFVALTLL